MLSSSFNPYLLVVEKQIAHEARSLEVADDDAGGISGHDKRARSLGVLGAKSQ